MFLSRRRNKLSNANLSHTNPTTLAPGNLIPISFTRIVSDRKYRFQPSAFVQAFPMNAPLVNGFKLCLEYFFIPDRLYNADLLLDFTGVTSEPDNVKYPSLKPTTLNSVLSFDDKAGVSLDAQNIVSPGSLADYMNFPVGFAPIATDSAQWTRRYNMLKAVGYLDVVYNYYINQQIPSIPTASYNYNELGAVNFSILVDTIGDFLRTLKTSSDPAQAIDKWLADTKPSVDKDYDQQLMSWAWLCSRKSIFQRCLPPYYLESWLATSGYQDAEIKVDLDADGQSISMRNISSMSHIQRWLDLAMAGGSRYSDYMNAEFDVSRVKNASTPVFLGADRQYLGSNVIYQTTGAGDSSSPLGAFAGQSSGGEKFRTRTFSFGESGYFMVMASLVPDVIYSRGLDPFLEELTLGDSYAPALDNIAMEPLMIRELNSVPVYTSVESDNITLQPYNITENTAVGYVPAWSKLTQVVSRSHGRLTTELAYWLLDRSYGYIRDADLANFQSIREFIAAGLSEGSITYERAEAVLALLERTCSDVGLSYSPYILPNAYNNVFADISNEAQNFVVTFSASASALREKSKVNVPTTL